MRPIGLSDSELGALSHQHAHFYVLSFPIVYASKQTACGVE